MAKTWVLYFSEFSIFFFGCILYVFFVRRAQFYLAAINLPKILLYFMAIIYETVNLNKEGHSTEHQHNCTPR